MAMSLVGTFTAAEGTGGLTTGSRTTTSGNLITAHGASYRFSGVPGAITLSDNKSNTFTHQTQQNIASGSDNCGVRSAYNANGTRGASHTVSGSYASTANQTLVAHEWSGIEATPTVVSANATGTSTAASGSVTAGAASGYIGTMIYLGSSTTFAPNGATQAAEVDENSDQQAMGTAYRTGLTGSNSVAWTIAASRLWGVTVSAFTEAASGGALNGASSITFSATGTLTGSGALSGATTLTFSPTATIIGTAPISGASTLTFSATGTLAGAGALSGASTIAFSPTGTLTGAGALSGSTTISFTPTSVLTGSGALSGSATITFDVAGTLEELAADALSGSTSISFTAVGVLSGTGALSGASTITFGAAGALTDAAAPPPVVAQSSGGGFFHMFDYHRARRERERRRRKELEEEAQRIEDETTREIAQLLHAQEAKEAERIELERLQALADRFATKPLGLPARTRAALYDAAEARTRNSLLKMQREIERMYREEDAALIVLLNSDALT